MKMQKYENNQMDFTILQVANKIEIQINKIILI